MNRVPPERFRSRPSTRARAFPTAPGGPVADADAIRALIDRRVRALLDLPTNDPLRHGTETAYVKLRCRCDLCRRAATEARMRRKWRDPEAYRDAQRRAYHLRKGREALPPPMSSREGTGSC